MNHRSLPSLDLRFLAACLVFLWLVTCSGQADAQLRIVDYNTAGVNNSSGAAGSTALQTIFAAIGDQSVNGVSRPLDVLILQEQNLIASDTAAIVGMLNGLYGPGTYASNTVNGATTGAGRPTLVYNTKTVQPALPGSSWEVSVVGTSSSGAARSPMRFQLRPVGYDNSANFYIYNSHYKASDTGADAARRNVEAQAIRGNADSLGQGASIIYAGDFNIYSSSEPMWATLTGSGNGQAFDPLNAVDGVSSIGAWSDNGAFRGVHTQSPATSSAYGGQVLGGMDDRFDFQLSTQELQDGNGMSYMPGSYQSFGNTNTHAVNGAVNVTPGGSPTTVAEAFQASLPGYTTAQAQNVLDQLTRATDHLPVVAQYQVPAKMATTLASVPVQVLVGTPLGAQVTVRNSAGDGTTGALLVPASNSADELNYNVSSLPGDVSGAASGSTLALTSGNSHTLSLNTSTAGPKSGTTLVDATSAQVPNAHQSLDVNYSVLDHANASLTALSDINTKVYNFGSFLPGSGTQHISIDICNLTATDGFTAGLDLLNINGLGDVLVLDANLALFQNLAAGTSHSFIADFDTTSPGSFMATYTLDLSDDMTLLGAAGGQQLLLTLVGVVVPEPGSLATLLIGGVLVAAASRRFRRGAKSAREPGA